MRIKVLKSSADESRESKMKRQNNNRLFFVLFLKLNEVNNIAEERDSIQKAEDCVLAVMGPPPHDITDTTNNRVPQLNKKYVGRE